MATASHGTFIRRNSEMSPNTSPGRMTSMTTRPVRSVRDSSTAPLRTIWMRVGACPRL